MMAACSLILTSLRWTRVAGIPTCGETLGSEHENSQQSAAAKFYRRSHDAVIRVYDDADNMIETHEPPSASSESHEHQSKASLVTIPPAVSTGDTLLVEITDALPANCNVYMRQTNCWFVLFHRFRQIATASFDTTKSANASQ